MNNVAYRLSSHDNRGAESFDSMLETAFNEARRIPESILRDSGNNALQGSLNLQYNA